MSNSDSEEEEILEGKIKSFYRAAAGIVNEAIESIVKEAVEGKNILELCELGDSLLKKKQGVGIAFPTCISVNHIAGHFSPEVGDKSVLKNGDVVKIDLGAHAQGYIVVSAHTHIVGNSEDATVGKAADVVCAAHLAGEAILKLLKPGHKNSEIPDVIKSIADAFHVNVVEAVLSHQMKRWVIDGTKVIPTRAVADQAVEEFEIEENDVYAIDIVMSTGSGKTREQELRPTVFKRALDQTYLLKLQAARRIFSEVNEKFPALPFSIRYLENSHPRFGLGELEKHGLIHPYPILYEKEGEIVAQFKYTALVMPAKTERLTGHPLPFVKSEYGLEGALKVKPGAAPKKRKSKKQKAADNKTKAAPLTTTEVVPETTNVAPPAATPMEL